MPYDHDLRDGMRGLGPGARPGKIAAHDPSVDAPAAPASHAARGRLVSSKQAHELLPTCHRVSALLKRWLLGTHRGSVKPEHLDYYLDELTLRFNRRYSGHRGLLFYRLVQQAANTTPQPYTSLLSETASKRRRRKEKAARRKCAEGVKGEVQNVARKAGETPRRRQDQARR